MDVRSPSVRFRVQPPCKMEEMRMDQWLTSRLLIFFLGPSTWRIQRNMEYRRRGQSAGAGQKESRSEDVTAPRCDSSFCSDCSCFSLSA